MRILGQILGLPTNVVHKPSSPNLWKDQLAEDEIGFTYDYIDPILHLLVDVGLSVNEVASKLNVPVDDVLKIKGMIESSRHKRMSPPIIPLPKEAFS